MFSRLFDRWTKSRSFTVDELLILKHLLAGNADFANKLLSQAVSTPYVERKLTASSQYEAVIPYVIDPSMLIDCSKCLESPPIFVKSDSGELLMFTTAIKPGGFLYGLKGQVVGGGNWPKHWKAIIETDMAAKLIEAWIPEQKSRDIYTQQLLQLCIWCGLSRDIHQRLVQTDRVRIHLPANQTDLDAFEFGHRVKMNLQYMQLMAITNGFEVLRQGWDAILGVQDLFFIDDDCQWLCFTESSEEYRECLRRVGPSISDECFQTVADGQPTYICDFRDYCRRFLTSCIE